MFYFVHIIEKYALFKIFFNSQNIEFIFVELFLKVNVIECSLL